MNAGSLQTFWFPLLALLAVEVGVIAGLVEVSQRWSSSAGWRRTFCQAGLVATLVLTVGELSGAGRLVAARVAGAVAGWRAAGLAPGTGSIRSSGASARNAGFDWRQSSLASESTQAGGEGARRETTDGKPTERAAELPGPRLPSNPIAESRAPSVEGPRSVPSSPSPRPSSPAAELPAGFWVALVLGMGALVVGGRVCFARCLFVLFRLRRRETVDAVLVERMERLARRLGLRRRVRVLASARLTGPIAFGWIWPSVALPAGFSEGLDEAKQDAVLLHELAHLAAHDPFWGLLADAATVILWWHPAVWRLRRQLQLANELAADEASLLVADGPRALAECLVQFGARLLERPVAGQIPVTGFRSHLGRRVQQLMRLEGATWSPPGRLPAALARSFGATAAAAAVVLCTAWATPRELTKGDSMKTIQHNWKQSLAAFAFLAAINGQDAVGRQAQSEPAALAPAVAPATTAPGTVGDPSNAGSQDVQLFQRSGNAGTNNNDRNSLLGAGNPLIRRATHNPTRAVAPAIEAKLKSIVLDEVKPMDYMPLSEVVKILIERARKGDPDGIGVNFVMDFKEPASPARGAGAVDPASGLPLAAPAAETVDLNSVSIKIPFQLHNITLWDMLNIMLKASDRPIQYTVEEYGVLFSLKSQTSVAEPNTAVAAAAPERLSVRTFKVDTNTVLPALWDTFHITSDASNRSQATQNALMAVFLRLGARLHQDALFYNGQTGVLMVRATREDMEVVSAIMETLTGVAAKPDPLQSEAGGVGRGIGSEASKEAEAVRKLLDKLAATVTLENGKGVAVSMATGVGALPAGPTEIRIFQLQHADPNQLVEQITQLFPDAFRTQNCHCIAVPDPRTHSVLLSAEQQLMPRISKMIEQLDTDAISAAATPGTERTR
jgi:beta-lactamase regulating signal transducer with metallopeptidase domain